MLLLATQPQVQRRPRARDQRQAASEPITGALQIAVLLGSLRLLEQPIAELNLRIRRGAGGPAVGLGVSTREWSKDRESLDHQRRHGELPHGGSLERVSGVDNPPTAAVVSTGASSCRRRGP